MSSKKVIITAGGTGGHLFPAQGLAQQLKKNSQTDILFVAGGLSKSRFFDRDVFSYKEVSCGPLLSLNLIKSMKGIFQILKGMKQSLAILKEFRPDVVVGFGSYYTVPLLLAARWLKIPIVLHEANSIPGKANRMLSSFAHKVGILFPSTASYFKGKAVEVGLPLREGYHLHSIDKDEALHYFNLKKDRQTLLICGGSQGAQAINHILIDNASLLEELSLQVIHLAGNQEQADKIREIYQTYQIPHCVKAFEKNMQFAWRAADAFIGRSGASTIAESIEFEVPGILIPYPHATDNHQEKNADFLVFDVKSCWKILEKDLTSNEMGKVLKRLFDPDQLHSFKNALSKRKTRKNQRDLCQIIMEGF